MKQHAEFGARSSEEGISIKENHLPHSAFRALRAVFLWPGRVVHWALYARPIRFTRFGLFYILFSLGVGAAAINTGNNLLYLMLGLLLGFIIISGFLSDSCLWGMTTEFQAVGDFYAGQPAEWDLVVRKNWFPGVILQIEAFWDHATTKHLFYWIPRYGEKRLRISTTPERRGRLHLKNLRYATRFPFGLFEKSHHYESSDSWVVFPKLQRLSAHQLHAAGAHVADHPADRKGLGATPYDIREYRAGDASKRIHWKSSAKRGQLMVSEMEEESAISQRIVVTRWPEEGQELERFVSFAASLVYTLHRQGQRVRFQTPGAHFDGDRSRTSLKNILTYLALVDPQKENSLSSPSSDRALDVLALWKKS